jgi:predicted acyltransferase
VRQAADTVMEAASRRLVSLDALRGFAMFWLLGGTALVRALTANAEEGTWSWLLRRQFEHVEWEGFRFYDFIFPLFLFCIGVAVPLSVEKRLEAGDSRWLILRRAGVRLWWMIFFGWWVNGQLLTWDPSRFGLSYSVLMMLGCGYFMAVVLVLFARERTQVLVTVGILLGYWALQMGVPVPGGTPGQFVPGGIFSDWLYDQTIGQLGAPWKSRYGRGALVSMWNHGATAMLGVFAWRVLQRSPDCRRAVLRLVVGGVLLLLLGWLWSWHLPIVKNRWTSSYVLWCGGLSWLLLALFYAVLDGLHWRRWAGLFLIIGSNSILAYLISTVFMAPFRSLASILFGGLSLWLSETAHAALLVLASYGAVWLLLAWLYRQKLFLRL